MHYRYWAVRSSRGLSQCLDSGLPIKHEPISFMRWQGFDRQLGFLERRSRRTDCGGWVEPFPSHVLWSVGAPVLCHAQLPSSFPTWCLSSETFVDYPFPSGMGYFYGGSPGGPWYDRDSASSTATWPRPPGSLMAPLTRWVEGDGHVLGARCRRTSDYCVSLVSAHVGPTWVS